MDNLHSDVMIVIFNKLLIGDLLNCIEVCKYFNELSNEDSVWRGRFPKKYLRKHQIFNCKSTYIKRYCDINNLKYLGVKNYDVTELRINKKFLIHIPKSICIFKQLVILNLSNTNMSLIPGNISCLSTLKQLDISRNHLKIFPMSICKLTKLHTLNLSSNKIKILPKDINLLNKLEHLSLYDCYIKHISKDINLPKLGYINLCNNELETIPDWIYDSDSLNFIDLSDNTELSITKTFLHNSKLRHLIVDSYQLPFFYTKLVNNHCDLNIIGSKKSICPHILGLIYFLMIFFASLY